MLKNYQHISCICLGFILGVAIASFVEVSISYEPLLVLACAACVLWNLKTVRVVFLILCAVLFGIFWYQRFVPHIPFHVEQKVSFIAKITADPITRIDSIQYVVETNDIPGRILITSRLYPKFYYGQTIEFTCSLIKPEAFEDFSYDRYLARFDIYWVCYYPQIKAAETQQSNNVISYIYVIKHRIQEMIFQNVREPQASILSAIVLGDKKTIPQEVFNTLRYSGIAHLIAISGLHISLIIHLLSSIAPRFFIPKNIAFFAITGMLLLYLLMIGFPASAVRASLLGWSVLLAYFVGRANYSFYMLLLIATGMILVNPKILRDDIGFQLSFAAMVGIIYFSPIIADMVKRLPSFYGIKQAFVITVSAQLTTTPLVIYYFKTFNPFSVLVNVLVVPLLPIVILATFFSVLLYPIVEPFGLIVFMPQELLLHFIVQLAEIFSRFVIFL